MVPVHHLHRNRRVFRLCLFELLNVCPRVDVVAVMSRLSKLRPSRCNLAVCREKRCLGYICQRVVITARYFLVSVPRWVHFALSVYLCRGLIFVYSKKEVRVFICVLYWHSVSVVKEDLCNGITRERKKA